MAGIRQLRQIQLGREATAGTATTATTRWRGLGALEDRRVVTFPEEYIGIIGGGDRSYVAKQEGALTMDDTDATFEQLPHLLIASIANTTAGTQHGTSSGYIYTYTIPTTTAPTINTYTVRAGDNEQAEIMAYSFVRSFSIKGNAGEAVMMSAEWTGRTVTTSTFSTGVSVPDVETILAVNTSMTIDAVSSTYGATPIDQTLISCEVNFSDMIMPKWVMRPGDGFNPGAFSFHYAGNREITGSLTYEHNSSATAEKEAFRNQTPRLLRLHFFGSALTTAGTTYDRKTLVIDLPIKYESFDALDDVDGNSIVKANFVSKYNATAGDAGKIIVVLNSTTSIP